MSWFKKKSRTAAAPAQTEITAHKDAIKKASQGAVSASLKLNNLIGNNGFTVIIAATMGAKHTTKGESGHGH